MGAGEAPGLPGGDRQSDRGHTTLEVAGMAPVIGEAADVANDSPDS
ncbi:hypothetical protein [Streptomyces chartreusis]